MAYKNRYEHLLALLAVVFAMLAMPRPVLGEAVPQLTVVRAVRALTPDQAREARPVRLRGIVTVLSGWKSSFFFQDSTSGISIDRLDNSPELHSGQRVEVRGYTATGMFAPIVIANSVTMLGEGKLPPARLFTPGELAEGKEDSQWIAIRGIVRSTAVRPSWGRLVLFLNIDVGGGKLITARIHDFPQTHWERLSDATVTVRGVCGTIFNDKRQFVGLGAC